MRVVVFTLDQWATGVVGLHAVIGVTVASSIMLLYTNFTLCSFFELSTTRKGGSFGLCRLIPPSTSTIFIASSVLRFITRMSSLTYDGGRRCLRMSGLFSCLGRCLCALRRRTPRKLDQRVGRVLVDFRRPSGVRGRILCYELKRNSQRLVSHFIRGCISSLCPPGAFGCGKRSVAVCPVTSKSFLTYCLASSFVTLDCRGGLVRAIVSTRGAKGSLTSSPAFTRTTTPGGDPTITAICTRLRNVVN